MLPALPGDFNGNDAVDAADYVILRDTMLSTIDLAADADRDLWLANYGLTSPFVAVPEPRSAGLMIAAIGALSPRLSRNRRPLAAGKLRLD